MIATVNGFMLPFAAEVEAGGYSQASIRDIFRPRQMGGLRTGVRWKSRIRSCGAWNSGRLFRQRRGTRRMVAPRATAPPACIRRDTEPIEREH